MPSWPATVPFLCVLPSLKYGGPQGTRVEFQPDVGDPKVRNRSTASWRQISGETSVLDTTQRAAFEAFWANDLAGGVLSFTATHPITGATATFQPTGQTYDVIARGAGKVSIGLSLRERI